MRFLRQFRGCKRAVVASILALLVTVSGCDDVISNPEGSSGRVARAIKLDFADFSLGRGASRQLQATILDQNQEPFGDTIPEGTSVEWSTSDTAIVTVTAAGVVTARQNGTARVNATLASAIGRPTVFANVVVSNSASHITSIGGHEQSASVGDQLPLAITFQASDDNNNPVPGVVINFAVEVGGGTVNPTTAITDENGNAQTTWTLDTVAGTWQIEASLADLPTEVTYVSAQALPGKAQKIQVVSGNNQSGTAGDKLENMLFAKVVDTYGNAVPNAIVSWTPFAPDHGSFDPDLVATDEEGLVSTKWQLGTAVGEVRAIARHDSLTPATFFATATAPEPTEYRLVVVSGNGQFAPMRHRTPEPLVVRLIDQRGRPVPDKFLFWENPSSGGVIEPNGEVTDENGELSADWVLGEERGLQNVQVRVVDVPGSLSATFTATAGNPPRSFRIVSGDGQFVLKGHPTPQPIVFRVLSFDTLPVRGVKVGWSMGTGDRGHIQVLNEYTNERGEVSIIYTPNGNNIVTANFIDPFYGYRNLSATVDVSTPLAVVAGNDQRAMPNQTLKDLIEVRLLDRFGDPIVGRKVTWTVTEGTGSTFTPVNGGLTDAQGIARASWKLGGIGFYEATVTADGMTEGAYVYAEAVLVLQNKLPGGQTARATRASVRKRTGPPKPATTGVR